MPPNVVVLAADGNLLSPALFAASRLAALNPRADTAVVLFLADPAAAASAAGFSLPFEVRALPPTPPFVGGLASPTWLRYAIPATLGESCRRILYIDVDAFVESPRLFALFDLDLGANAVAGVRDIHIAFVGDKAERQATLGPGRHKYLNSGVLLLDAAGFRSGDIPERLAALAGEPPGRLLFTDQSALNIVLAENWLELSPSFNMLMQVWRSPLRAAFDPVVVHFAGVVKFWQGDRFSFVHHARAAFEAFQAHTAWRGADGALWPPPLSAEAFAAPANMPPRGYGDYFPGRARVLRFLRETPFADVVQGLNPANLAALPAA